jgi:ATP synthase protein I
MVDNAHSHVPKESLADRVGAKAARKMRARRQRSENLLYWLGIFGLVGWSVALPTLLGIAVGISLDRAAPGRISWTLTCLFLGLTLGCANAWYAVRKEFRRK